MCVLRFFYWYYYLHSCSLIPCCLSRGLCQRSLCGDIRRVHESSLLHRQADTEASSLSIVHQTLLSVTELSLFLVYQTRHLCIFIASVQISSWSASFLLLLSITPLYHSLLRTRSVTSLLYRTLFVNNVVILSLFVNNRFPCYLWYAYSSPVNVVCIQFLIAWSFHLY